MNVLDFPEGHCPKATDISPWYGVYESSSQRISLNVTKYGQQMLILPLSFPHLLYGVKRGRIPVVCYLVAFFQEGTHIDIFGQC